MEVFQYFFLVQYQKNLLQTIILSAKIDPGYWTVNVKTYTGACAMTITAQSAIQVYPGYSRNIHDDFGYVAPLSGNRKFSISKFLNLQ